MTGTLHEDRYILMKICCSFILKMRNVSDETYGENQNTHFMFKKVFPKIVPFMR